MASQLVPISRRRQLTIESYFFERDNLGFGRPLFNSHNFWDASKSQLEEQTRTESIREKAHANDNPFSESQFKTLKYRPDFPKRFGSHEDALAFCRNFFDWYNNEHYHSGIGLLTPSSLHYGRAPDVIEALQETLRQAWRKHPERFVDGVPAPAELPKSVWINPPHRTEKDKREAPQANCQGALQDTTLTHSRSGYPSAGCVPAEPTSVSPDRSELTVTTPLEHRSHASKNPGGPGAGLRLQIIKH